MLDNCIYSFYVVLFLYTDKFLCYLQYSLCTREIKGGSRNRWIACDLNCSADDKNFPFDEKCITEVNALDTHK